MMILGVRAYQSGLHRLDPAAKALISSIPFFICLFAGSILADLASIGMMLVLTDRYARLTLKEYLNLMRIPAGFLLLGITTILVQSYPADQNVLVGLTVAQHRIGVSQTALMEAMNLFLRSIACISCMYFFMLTTTMPDFLTLLRRWRCPQLLASLMELIYRYIFILLEEAQRIRIAQISRLGDKNFRIELKAAGTLIGQLFLRTYLRSDRIHQAMISRGYTGSLPSLSKQYSKSPEWIWLAIGMGLLLFSLALLERKVMGWLL